MGHLGGCQHRLTRGELRLAPYIWGHQTAVPSRMHFPPSCLVILLGRLIKEGHYLQFWQKYTYSSLENFSFDLIIQEHILKLKMVRKHSHVEIWSRPSFFSLFSPSFFPPSSFLLSIPLFLPYISTTNTLFWGISHHSEEWFPILQAQMKKYFSDPHPLRGQRHETGSAITSFCRLQVERW